MALIGAASGALFALDQQWLYTSSIAKIAYGDTPFTFRAIAVPIALIVGMVVAVVIGGMFRLQTGNIREWARAASGGLLMGIGATFVPGGKTRCCLPVFRCCCPICWPLMQPLS